MNAAELKRTKPKEITLSAPQRWNTLVQSMWARRTCNQNNLAFLIKGFDYSHYRKLGSDDSSGFSDFFNANAHAFGDRMKANAMRDSQLRDALFALKEPDNKEPYLIIRGAFPIKNLRYSYSTENTWFVKRGYYDIISSGIIALTGARHRRKLVTDDAKREYKTTLEKQKHFSIPDYDMPLRYRNATPERLFPWEPVAENEPDKLAVRIIVFACIENPILDPIWILPLSRFLHELDDNDRSLLADGKFAVYDRLQESLNRMELIRDQAILTENPYNDDDWFISLDPNRIDFQDQDTDQASRNALAKLLGLIEKYGKDEKSGAVPVTLNAGDALVVDNYRALYCRKEPPYKSFQPLMLGEQKPVRLLRAYYGFPN